MDFGAASQHLKAGRCVARSGWLGKGILLCIVPGLTFKVSGPPLLGILADGADVRCHGYIGMFVNGQVVQWAKSDQDLLADDWVSVDPGAPAKVEPPASPPELGAGAAEKPANDNAPHLPQSARTRLRRAKVEEPA